MTNWALHNIESLLLLAGAALMLLAAMLSSCVTHIATGVADASANDIGIVDAAPVDVDSSPALCGRYP